MGLRVLGWETLLMCNSSLLHAFIVCMQNSCREQQFLLDQHGLGRNVGIQTTTVC